MAIRWRWFLTQCLVVVVVGYVIGIIGGIILKQMQRQEMKLHKDDSVDNFMIISQWKWAVFLNSKWFSLDMMSRESGVGAQLHLLTGKKIIKKTWGPGERVTLDMMTAAGHRSTFSAVQHRIVVSRFCELQESRIAQENDHQSTRLTLNRKAEFMQHDRHHFILAGSIKKSSSLSLSLSAPLLFTLSSPSSLPRPPFQQLLLSSFYPRDIIFSSSRRKLTRNTERETGEKEA